jgi:hypothetical protein
MVCHAGGSFRTTFGAYQGITQGEPFSSLMFNVRVDMIIREWLRTVLGDNAAQGGIGEAIRGFAVVFFVDNGLVTARCPGMARVLIHHLYQPFQMHRPLDKC